MDVFVPFEIEWEGNWTAAQKAKIENALAAVKARVDALIKEIDDYLDSLSPCVRATVAGDLNRLKQVLEKVSAGIASNGENLELYHVGNGHDDPFAATFPAGWYGINGFWSDGQITFNDDASPSNLGNLVDR